MAEPIKCPTCGKAGYKPPSLGRPPTLDDEQVRAWHDKGKSAIELAEKFGVSRVAIYKSLARSKPQPID